MKNIHLHKGGKSTFIYNLIKFRRELFTSEFDRIIYCQPEHLYLAPKNQEMFKKIKSEFPKLEICLGLPDISKLRLNVNSLPCLLILEDLMCEILSSEEMLDLLISEVHSHNISTCFTLQVLVYLTNLIAFYCSHLTTLYYYF